MFDFILNVFVQTWVLTAEMAPYLFLGFIIAGVLHVFMPVDFISRHAGGESFLSVLKASLLGIPLPLCSCGVLPVAASLRKAGAGKAPTLSFLITTPVTGVDSIMATWSLMGWLFTLLRLISAIVIGMATGVAMLIFGNGNGTIPLESVQPECIDCQKSHEHSHEGGKIRNILRYAFIELPGEIAGSILFGLLLGGLIVAVLPPEVVSAYLGSGIWGMLVAVAVAIPLYVCATGSIPIAAGMLAAGFSPGAALAFLIAGPATNTVGMTTVRKLLGKRALIVYLSVIFLGSIVFGLLFDAIFSKTGMVFPVVSEEHGLHGLAIWEHIAGGVLLAITLSLLLKEKVVDRLVIYIKGKEGRDKMNNNVMLSVPSMTCAGCKTAVMEALLELSEVQTVDVHLGTKTVLIGLSKPVLNSKLVQTLAKVGYEASVS